MIPVQERRRLAKLIVNQLLKVMEQKSHDYGNEGWQELGLKGNFADIHKKYKRIKTLVWESVKPIVKESLQDTYEDMANYVILALVMIYSEKNRGNTKT